MSQQYRLLNLRTKEQWEAGDLTNLEVTEDGILRVKQKNGGTELIGERINPPIPISFIKSALSTHAQWSGNNLDNVEIYIGYSNFYDQPPEDWYIVQNNTELPEFPLLQPLDGYLWTKQQIVKNGELSNLMFTVELNTPAQIVDIEPVDPVQAVLLSHRVERFRFELLDKDEKHKKWLDTVFGGELNVNFYTELKISGAVNIVDDTDIDYKQDRIKIYRDILIGDTWQEYPLGVFLLSSPEFTTDGKIVERSVELYSKLLILQQDIMPTSYTITQGTHVITAIKNLIESTGEHLINIEENDIYMAANKTFAPGESKLAIINNLLTSMNYGTLWVDGGGHYRAERYIRPDRRPNSYIFADDLNSIYSPEITIDTELTHIPNRVILITESFDAPPKVITKDLGDILPDSPFTYENVGRWIVRREVVDDAPVEVLEGLAERLLLEGIRRIERLNFNHAWVPIGDAITQPQNAILFKNNLLNIAAKYTIHSQKIPLTVGGLIQTNARRAV